jgi:tetratricopeptide (TPR) repeat protein
LLQFEAALGAYNSVIQMNPRHPHAHMNRAIVLKKLGRWEDALTGYETAQDITPTNAEIYYNKGLLFHEMGRLSEARESFNAALSLDSHQEKYFYGRAKIHYDLEEYEASLDDYTHVLNLNAHHLEALLNIGAVYQRLNKYQDAIKAYKKVIDIDPSYSEALYNASLAELSIGDFSSGWDHYEGRLQEKFFQKASLADELCLSAEFSVRNLRADLKGKTIFLAAEQGIGDHIMFLSMLPDLSRDTDKIIWTIVLCTLNILGVVLYWILAPAGRDRVLSEQELKDKFNKQ